MVGNQGLPLAPIPTRRLAVLTQITSEFAHCSLSGAERRKKKHPDVPGMYSASVSCSASRKRNPVSRPSAVCTLCMGILFASDKSGWIHASLHNEWKEHPSIIVMPSRRQLLHFFFHMDDCNEYFIRGQWGDYVKRPLCGSGNAPELFSFYGLNNKEYDIE